MRYYHVLLLPMVIALASGIAPQAAAQSPVLVKATFFSHTNDEDKDHDTGVYVTLSSSDGSSTIAHADNRDNSGDDGTQYKDGSDHQFDLDLDAPALDKQLCKGAKVHVYIHTHGNDTWRFNGRVVLYFSDHSNITASSGNVELNNDGAATDFSAPAP